ncbi:MAG: MOSC domain-containing protein [bacterium]
MNAKVVSVNVSKYKGTRKENVPCALLKVDFGVEGDAHAGQWHRQVSLLAIESIEKMREKGADVGAGDFAENVTTEGIDLVSLPVGSRLRVGEAIIEITQRGKECHEVCEILRLVGTCVMPREGIFARVIRGGEIRPGNSIRRESTEREDEK